jgi:CBS domain containing-hemolysin-like protein
MGNSTANSRANRGAVSNGNGNGSFWRSAWRALSGFFGGSNSDTQLRDTIEEIIEEIQESENPDEGEIQIGSDERIMLGNILKLRHITAYDVMVPRVDIASAEVGVPLDELIETMSSLGHSRLPVYRETLDEVVGIVHIKDIIDYVKQDRPFDITDILRRVLVVAPSMRVLDLLLDMREQRVHMALVVDEYGGIDGLVTIEDLVEEIVGEIEDEHDIHEGPKLTRRPDGTMLADARTTIEEFEDMVGPVLSEEERQEDIDTLGGLLFTLTGRVPGRGELIEHEASGISFEVIEADPRRIKRLRLHNVPESPSDPHDG